MPPTSAPAPRIAPTDPRGSRPGLAGLAGLLGWVGVLVAVIIGFTALGAGPLAPPPLAEPSTWADWAAGREPLLVAFTVARLAVLAIAWYLLGVTVLGAAARLLRWGRLVTVADLLTIPSVRRLLQTSLGLGLATAALTAAPVADLTPAEPTVASVQLAMQRDASQSLGGSSAVMASVGEEGPTAIMRAITEEEQVPATWEVATGQHFWSIAEQVLAASWDRAPSEAETTAYWAELVEANRDGLADPGNPDLVYPGQVVTLPAPPPAPPSTG